MKYASNATVDFIDGELFSTIINFNVKEDNSDNIREKTREKTREKILKLMKINETITTKQLAESIGISTKGIEYHIAILKKQNKIKRIGSDKGGKWKVLIKLNK